MGDFKLKDYDSLSFERYYAKNHANNKSRGTLNKAWGCGDLTRIKNPRDIVNIEMRIEDLSKAFNHANKVLERVPTAPTGNYSYKLRIIKNGADAKSMEGVILDNNNAADNLFETLIHTKI